MIILLAVYFTIGFILAGLNLRIQIQMREAEPIHYVIGFFSLLFFWLPIYLYIKIKD